VARCGQHHRGLVGGELSRGEIAPHLAVVVVPIVLLVLAVVL
jgi:hypothetical protein